MKMGEQKRIPLPANQQKKIHGTLVKVTDENIDDVAKAIVEKILKTSRSKGH